MSEVELVLIEGECDRTFLQEVQVLSLEVYGQREGDEQLCTLDKRCVFDVDVPEPADDAEDLMQILRTQQQPLIDTELEGAQFVGIVGRREPSCWRQDVYPLCGFADLANVSDGRLELRLTCGGCTDETHPNCP